MVDTHAHLNFPQFDDDREEVVARALAAGVGAIINVGADLNSSRQAISLAERYPQIYAAVGIHPHDAETLTAETLAEIQTLARHPRVVAIGETGLDYYRDLSPRGAQRRAFEAQLALASELGVPVIVHDREAHSDVTAILRRWVGGRHSSGGVLHCFSGNLDMAQEAMEWGFYISIAGPVTFTNARRLPELVRRLPLTHLLIETDCPYLAPHPYRGKRNEPAHLKLVAQAIAGLKATSLEEIARVTADNANALFTLKLHAQLIEGKEGP